VLLGAQQVTITPQSGSYSGGVWTSTPGASYQATATIIPAPKEELERLPEGARTKSYWLIYVEGEELTVGSPGKAADRVTWQGRELVVIAESDYSAHASGVPHRAYLLAEVGDDE